MRNRLFKIFSAFMLMLYLVATIGLGIHRCHSCGNVEALFFLNTVVDVEHVHHHSDNACGCLQGNGIMTAGADEDCTEIFVVREDVRISSHHADDYILLAATLPIIYIDDVRSLTEDNVKYSGLYDGVSINFNIQDYLSEVSQWRL